MFLRIKQIDGGNNKKSYEILIIKNKTEKLFETFVYRIIMKGSDFDVISFKQRATLIGGINFVFA